jgi:serine/threonine protein kinase
MSAPAKLDEYLDFVRKSAILDERRLDQYVQKLRSTNDMPAEPGKLAGLMVRDGLLTQFQAEQLLLGRWRRFTIGKYRVLERLGSGGMGLVYLCEHQMMKRRVAVKVLPSAKAKDPASLERFKREARAAAILDHPNIVHAYDIDQDEELHFLVMEYVEGASLHDIVKKTGPMDVVRACHYIRQAALGIEHAHQKGLVHRDIKPDNILVDRSGTVKILDMGLARFFNDEDDILTKKYDENVLGTGDYMSPEQIEDSHGVDTRADIYSLGATFYYLLAGHAPFSEGKAHQKLTWVLTKQPKPVTALRSGVPESLSNIIAKMMAKKPADRYPNLQVVADALAPWTQNDIPPPSEAEMPALSPAMAGYAAETSPTTVSRAALFGIPAVAIPAGSASFPPNTAASATAITSSSGSVDTAWRALSQDDTRPTAQTDTVTPGRRLSPLEEQERLRRRKLILIGAAAFLGVLVGVVIAYVIAIRSGGNSTPTPRAVLEVSTKKGYRTIAHAMKEAKDHDIIELGDEIHAESLQLRKPPAVTLQAKAGVKVTWVPTNPGEPLLRLQNAKNFRLKGKNLTLDGNIRGKPGRRVENLIHVEFTCPGLVLEDAVLQGFANYGVAITNCAGSAELPIRLINLRIIGDKSEAAVYFNAFPDSVPAKNNHIHVEKCTFSGFGEHPIARRSNEVTEQDVKIPGDFR